MRSVTRKQRRARSGEDEFVLFRQKRESHELHVRAGWAWAYVDENGETQWWDEGNKDDFDFEWESDDDEES